MATGDRRSRATLAGAVTWLDRAAVDALVDAAADPAGRLDELDAVLAISIAEVQGAAARAIADLRILEGDLGQAALGESEWADKARESLARARSLRTNGEDVAACRFEELAQLALRRQATFGGAARDLQRKIARQVNLAERSRSELSGLRSTRAVVRVKRARMLRPVWSVPA